MSSPDDGQASHDYTEGATPIDIQLACDNQRRARRDSRHSNFYGEEHGSGSVYAGPGHAAIPSSVSRMSRGASLGERRMSTDRRRGLDRRQSGDSVGSYYARSEALSDGDGEYASGEENGDEEGTSRGRDRTAKSPPRQSMFETITNIFGGRPAESPTRNRRSRSRRSSMSSRRSGRTSIAASEEGDERWGYSSGEEDEEEEDGHRRPPSDLSYGSFPPSPTNASLPLLSSGDAVFGDEARIDMDVPLEDDSTPPPGPPSRQNVYLQDEDAHVRFLGFEQVAWRQWVWRAGCVLSLGVLGLLGHWFPRLWISWVAREKAFKDVKNGFVVIEVRPVALSSHASPDG
jgi:cation-transporting ATPase 13A2